MNENPLQLDPHTCAFYLHLPGSKVVLLQAFFELYEGLATVRTIDIRRSLVCVLTTPQLAQECRNALEALRDQNPWRFAPPPAAETSDRISGYTKKRF